MLRVAVAGRNLLDEGVQRKCHQLFKLTKIKCTRSKRGLAFGAVAGRTGLLKERGTLREYLLRGCERIRISNHVPRILFAQAARKWRHEFFDIAQQNNRIPF